MFGNWCWLLAGSTVLLLSSQWRATALPPPSPESHAQIYDVDVVEIDANAADHDRKFFRFVTRPDIVAPRWHVKKYEDALSPGYWFTSRYEKSGQGKDTEPWIGPMIYDSEGELIWSGAPMFHGFNINDVRVTNVNGENMITGLYPHMGTAVVVDSSYTIQKQVEIGKGTAQHLNLHDFHTVYDGTTALSMAQKSAMATKDELRGINRNGRCKVIYTGFEEYDTTTWKRTFHWTSQGHIHLNESYLEQNCGRKWDYLHGNSVDKFPDGDYLYSGRHTDTVYKISGKDGSIVWRLTRDGETSDFAFSDHFSGQHAARVISQNETSIVISMLDNADGVGESHKTNSQSRGMLILLRTDTSPMSAHVLRKYTHPHGGYAPGRGNMQILEDQNVFMSWWAHSLQSEYSPDGRLLMEAEWPADLKSYRSYKFPWVGRPKQPPDVYSQAVTEGNSTTSRGVSTVVYMSWNGATEVERWNLYEPTKSGKMRKLIASVPRQGFETMLLYPGYARNIIVEGMDRNGKALGESKVVKSIPPADTSNPAVLEEGQHWIQKHSGTNSWNLKEEKLTVLRNPISAYICGVVTCAVVVFVFRTIRRSKKAQSSPSWWHALRQRKRHMFYEPVPQL